MCGTKLSVALVLVVAAVSCSVVDDPADLARVGGADTKVAAAHAAEIYTFDTLPEMLATSDAAIEATVTDIRPGHVVEQEPGDMEGRVEFQDLVLRVDQVHYLKGTLDLQVSDEVLLSQLARESGNAVVINNVQPEQIGDSGFYFLFLVDSKVSGESGESIAALVFDLISSQGRYLIQADGTLKGSNGDDPLVQQLQVLTAEQMRVEIQRSKESIRLGQVQPQPPPVLCPVTGCIDNTPRVSGSGSGTIWEKALWEWEVLWECMAEATGQAAATTRVESCVLTLQEPMCGNTRTQEAAPVEMPGNLAATAHSAGIGLVGGWGTCNQAWELFSICWVVSATFVEDLHKETVSDCRYY